MTDKTKTTKADKKVVDISPATTSTPVEKVSKRSKKEVPHEKPVDASSVVATQAPVQETSNPVRVKKTPKSVNQESASVASVTTVSTVQTENGEENDHERYFRCVYKDVSDNIVKSGRYRGKKPQQAARKALRCIVKKNSVSSGTSVVFVMVECTRNSKKKTYMYSGYCAKLDTPIEVPITKKDGTKSSIKYHHGQPKVSKASFELCTDLLTALKCDNIPEQVEEVKNKVKKEKQPSKRVSKKQTTESAPVVETTLAPVVETTPLVEQKPKKKSKKQTTESTPAPAVEATPATAPAQVVEATPATAPAQVVEATPATEQKPAKKAKASK
jgi:hypothetical protein